MSDTTSLLWIVCAVAAAIAVGVELVTLQRQRRLLLHDRPRRRFFVRSVQGSAQLAALSPPGPTTQPSATPTTEPAAATPHNGGNGSRRTQPRSSHPQDGIVYIDADGRCTFINQAARTLLQWDGGSLRLSDVLAGGAAESAALVEALKRQGLVEQHLTSLATASTPLELSAVALRDRDDNLWGAAVFIHTPAVASGTNGDSQL